ncbi:P-loop containing nucleoside triphosphate hydrolase protein [Lentinula raphanica]|uniref:DNA 3'-5' helicase n=1 Tax=Lentinula raphanica TaxID=153919 RepID=A0AA38P7I4_9AGAR|nr:P-loop containing nucleoside triphosphate hydrolase protein [Lentinula raphanica]
MPSKYPEVLDETRLKKAERLLCDVFGISELREHQRLAGKNILRGQTTVYDVPTGGGKTLAFWYPLFYYWDTRDSISTSQKLALVISPLNALMNSQAEALQEKGVLALAVNSEGGRIEDIFETRSDNQFCLKYRVIFISPETALSTQFHDKVLKKRIFRENIMQLIIDESHSASEWGENFRPEYAELGKLLARLPSGLPVLLASATMPEDVLRDVLFKVGLPQNPARVAVSNAKQNVALSVRVLQHPSNTYADLYTLLPTHENEAFPQTLIYVNSRIQAEEIQDFFRTRRPSHIPAESFEFYHRNITQQRKEHIQDGLRSGRLCCVIATD